MTNQQIIPIIIGALISSFAKSIFDKVLGPYIPDRKKLSSYIRKVFFFSAAYLVPIASIAYLMTEYTAVSKVFVLLMVFDFFGLAINFSIYLQNSINKSLIQLSDLTHNAFVSVSEAMQATFKDLHNSNSDTVQVTNKQIIGIYDLMRGLNDLQNILHNRLKDLEDEQIRQYKQRKKR